MTTCYAAALTVAAGPGAIWRVLIDPALHTRLDASGTVGAPATGEPLSRVGQVFTMNMSYDDGDRVTRYRSDNHVSVFEPERSIAWMTAVVGGPPLGWTWRYDLNPAGSATRVTLSYDWGGTSAESIARFAVPNRTPQELHATLVRLAGLVDADAAGTSAS